MPIEVITGAAEVTRLDGQEIAAALAELGVDPRHTRRLAARMARDGGRVVGRTARAAVARGLVRELRGRIAGAQVKSQSGGRTSDAAQPGRYRFVPPPSSLVSPEPARLFGEVVPAWAAYQAADAEVLAAARSAGDRALGWLEGLGFRPRWPEEAAARAEHAREFCVALAAVVDAARHCAVVRGTEPGVLLPLAPGEVPRPVEAAIRCFLMEVRREDVTDFAKIRAVGEGLGHPPVEVQDAADLADLVPWYAELPGVFAAPSPLLEDLSGRLRAAEPSRWWFDGGDLARGSKTWPEFLEDDGAFPGNIVIPPMTLPREGEGSAPPEDPTPDPSPDPVETPPDPPETPPDPPERPGDGGLALAVAFAVSDLHLGQGNIDGAVDNAEEVYPALEAAYVAAIGDWGAWTRAFRGRGWVEAHSPAYLILNGDILDFWSADVTGIGGGQLRADVEIPRHPLDPALSGPKVTRQIALGRMNRIVGAHPDFFAAVKAWVDQSPLNFVVYVGGNHDDYIQHHGLAPDLLPHLHPSRAAFAAESVYFPQLRAVFEHGHRGDRFNVRGPEFGGATCQGELMVSLFVNPVERGGASALRLIMAQPNHGSGAPLLEAAYNELEEYYDAVEAARGVDPETYDAWMGAVDNLVDEVEIMAIPDLAGKALAQASPADADAADVSDLDSHFEGMLVVFATNEFMEFWTRLFAGAIIRGPEWLQRFVHASMAEPQMDRLGFHDAGGGRFDGRKKGLGGDPAMVIHCVGHTHRVDETQPKLSGEYVSAQHANTGTGQDTFAAKDVREWDGVDANLTDVSDSLTAVEGSMGCLVQLTRWRFAGRRTVKVSGIRYRTKGDLPSKAGDRRVRGGFLDREDDFYNLVLLDE
ncbi:hypothetical protein L6R50_05190 [Myxococcota bacterium]|nr:hypothetical protein [Myxococcota bacterium]